MLKKFVFFLFFLCVWPLSACAESPSPLRFSEGVHYEAIDPPLPTRDPGRIEVVEYFWYGCPHCFQLEPSVERWAEELPRDVDFWRSPAMWNDRMRLHARAYYAADALGALNRLHPALFRAINRDDDPLSNAGAIRALFERNGIDGAKFEAVFDAFGISNKVNQADQRFRSAGLRGVPALVVQGKYRITGRNLRSHEEMFEVVDHLIARERAQP